MAAKDPPSPSDTTSRDSSSRPHSASISSVHFAELRNRPSTASLRSQRGPNHPSPLNLSTLPKKLPSPESSTPPASPNGAILPLTSYPAVVQPLRPYGYEPPSLSQAISPMEKSPSFPPARRSCQDRRVRSEGASPRPERPGQLIAHGKRPSLITGGYETSSDEGESSPSEGHRPFVSTTHPVGLGIRAQSDHGRRRDQTLVSTTVDENTPSSEVQGVNGLGIDTKRKSTRRLEEVASRRTLRDALRSPPLTFHPPSRISSQKSARSQILPTSRSDPYFPPSGSAGPSRMPSARSQPAHNRSASTRIRESEERENGVSSPEESRKGKERAHQIGGLAASLGLNGAVRDVALSPGKRTSPAMLIYPEQINNLLNDSDVATALRMINSNRLPTSRAYFNDANSSHPSTRTGSPAPHPHAEPFLVSAPTALTNGDARNRMISGSSTVTPGQHSNWEASRKRDSVDSSMFEGTSHERRRRVSSRVVAPQVEGGHVPFTHHIPVFSADETEGTDDGDTPVVSNGVPPAIEISGLQRALSKLSPMPAGEKKGRFNQLFHLKRKKSGELAAPPTWKRDSLSEPSRFQDRGEPRAKETLERESRMRQKEQERREAELAQGELYATFSLTRPERRYRTLTQIAAHPASERVAYHTSSHLRAFYNHIYEGIDNPPKTNPLAVLRWRLRMDDQREAKANWEAEQSRSTAKQPSPAKAVAAFGDTLHSSPVTVRSSPNFGGPRTSSESGRPSWLGASYRFSSPFKAQRNGHDTSSSAKGWKYTVEDVAAYKESGGTVNYFIPPRPTPSSDAGSEQEPHQSKQEEGSSVADSMAKDDDFARARVTNASVLSLNGPRSMESPDASLAPLSRSTSIETGGRSGRSHRDRRVGRVMVPARRR